jgi:hypothetical protein
VKDKLGICLKKTCSSITTVPEVVWINGRYPWKNFSVNRNSNRFSNSKRPGKEVRIINDKNYTD